MGLLNRCPASFNIIFGNIVPDKTYTDEALGSWWFENAFPVLALETRSNVRFIEPAAQFLRDCSSIGRLVPKTDPDFATTASVIFVFSVDSPVVFKMSVPNERRCETNWPYVSFSISNVQHVFRISLFCFCRRSRREKLCPH